MDLYQFASNGGYAYDQMWYTVHRPFFEFTIKANKSAHVLLAKWPFNDTYDVHEVIFGAYDNQQTIIRWNR